MGSIWHIGIAVPDLEEGKAELGEVFGLHWRPSRVRKLTLADAVGRPCEVECHVVFSLGGPFAVEVWQAIPGTPLDVPEAGGVHHIGYWVDDLAATASALEDAGYRQEARPSGAGLSKFAYYIDPAGVRIEIVDRALFPDWFGFLESLKA